MTFREREFVFSEEIDRLEAEREELAAEVAELPDDHPQRAQKAKRGLELDKHLDGVEWAATAHDDGEFPQWDADVDGVTLAGITGGEFGSIKGEVSEASQNNLSPQQVELVEKVRMGTVEAPYLDGDMTETDEIAAVAGLPVGFLEWASDQIGDLSSVGNGERSDFATLLAEKQRDN